MNTAEKKYRTIIHFTTLMQIVRDAIEIQLDKHELDPPVPSLLLSRSPDINFTLGEKHILRANASTKFRSTTQPLQELVNRGTEFLTIGLEQFRQFSGIKRAFTEREKRRFYTYWCKAQTYLRAVREEMAKHKILLDIISETDDQLMKQTQLRPLPELNIIQEEISRHEILQDKFFKLRKREQR